MQPLPPLSDFLSCIAEIHIKNTNKNNNTKKFKCVYLQSIHYQIFIHHIASISVFDKHHDDNDDNDFNHGEEGEKVIKYIILQNDVDNDVDDKHDDHDDEEDDDDNGNIRSQFNLFLLGR